MITFNAVLSSIVRCVILNIINVKLNNIYKVIIAGRANPINHGLPGINVSNRASRIIVANHSRKTRINDLNFIFMFKNSDIQIYNTDINGIIDQLKPGEYTKSITRIINKATDEMIKYNLQ